MTTPSLLLAFLSLAASAPQGPAPGANFSKRLVEFPLQTSTLAVEASDGSCTPGLVRWHADFAAACAAAERSKKPVLLFQLLGRLDEEFC